MITLKLNLVDTTDELYDYQLTENVLEKQEYDYLTAMFYDEECWFMSPICVEDEYDEDVIEKLMANNHKFESGDTIAFLSCDWDDINISICCELTFKKENLFLSDDPFNSDRGTQKIIIYVNETDAIMLGGEFLYLKKNDLATINKTLNKNYKAVIHFS